MHNIDIVIRFHDFAYLESLKDTLLSLSGQRGSQAHPIVMCQNFSPREVAYLREALIGYEDLFSSKISINTIKSKKSDIRSQLLNAGFAHGKNPYIAILDCDDVVYPNAYSFLCGKLATGGSAIAFGAITWVDVEYINGYPYIIGKDFSRKGGVKFDMLVDNFCPIHSFVIDRSKIQATDLVFDESMTMLEDYGFLLKIISTYESDFSGTSTFVGEYRRRKNDTIRNSAAEFDVKKSDLEIAREKISKLKDQLKISCGISEFTKLAKHWGGNSKSPPSSDNEDLKFSDFIRANKRANHLNFEFSKFDNFLFGGNLPVHNFGVLEAIELDPITGGRTASGWISGEKGRNFEGILLLVGQAGDFFIIDNFTERADVHLAGHALKSGFRAEISSGEKLNIYCIEPSGRISSLRRVVI